MRLSLIPVALAALAVGSVHGAPNPEGDYYGGVVGMTSGDPQAQSQSQSQGTPENSTVQASTQSGGMASDGMHHDMMSPSQGQGSVNIKEAVGSSPTPSSGGSDITVISMSQGGSNQPQMMTQPMNPGQTHTVTVGGSAGLVYTPDTIQAQPGDIVQFNFMQKNHTVTQSSFDKPCVKSGIDSGFMPNDGSVNPPPSFTVQVMSTKPIWFYCRQKTGTHCGKGMVFSINPTADKTQATYKQMAIQQNGTADGAQGMASPQYQAAAVQSPPASQPPAPQANQANYQMGSGTSSGGQNCQCMCLCGAGSWPSGTGMNHYGGFGGQMPASWGPSGSSGYLPPAGGASM